MAIASMSTTIISLSHLQFKGSVSKIKINGFRRRTSNCQNLDSTTRKLQHCASCSMESIAVSASSYELHDLFFELGIMKVLKLEDTSQALSNVLQRMVVGDLDPATAKIAIGVLGPALSAFSFLFIIRIVMSWYPKLPVDKFPYVVAYAPTEPILFVTRKVIPPVGGVDVTPVVWFGLLSFANEILVGPQGLLVLLSQQV